jgi:hypothetical protein
MAMTLYQRGALILGAICVLHSSMVPPVAQVEGAVCRYHAFVERSFLFTRTYGVPNADVVALVTEYGVIISVFSITYLLLGMLKRKTT